MKKVWRSVTVLGATSLMSCANLPDFMGSSGEPDVVYALGTRESFKSPLETALTPASSALEFSGGAFNLSAGHRTTLDQLAKEWPETKGRYLITGFAPPNLPPDYARALSERRAQAARQHLIERGVEAANVQTVGFGQDSASAGPARHVVVIYKQP